MKLVLSKRFVRNLSKLKSNNPEYGVKVAKTLKNYLSDPGTASLRLHKIRGSKEYSISVDMTIRIRVGIEDDKSYLLDIGKHEDIY
jgi:mRNA-degrading endonuclease YafQ of YafQ-DinJ toxin-antitoxin module